MKTKILSCLAALVTCLTLTFTGCMSGTTRPLIIAALQSQNPELLQTPEGVLLVNAAVSWITNIIERPSEPGTRGVGTNVTSVTSVVLVYALPGQPRQTNTIPVATNTVRMTSKAIRPVKPTAPQRNPDLPPVPTYQ